MPKIAGTQLTTNNNNQTSSKPYVTTNVCEPDKNATDPQAAVNNPGVPFQHKEIQRGTCPQPDCKEQDCGPLLPGNNHASCNNDVTTVESVGHATSGNLNIPTGKTIPLDTNVNMVGQYKQQNFFVYNIPHSTGITPEAFPTPGNPTGKGTDFLHDPNHPHRVAAVIQETKNK